MKLKIINQDYHYGSVSDVQVIPMGNVVTVPCKAFPDEDAARKAIADKFAEEWTGAE